MKVKITRVDKSLPLPKYHTKGSVGCDLYARVTTKIPSKSFGKIPANVIIQTPPGYMFMITLRSSTPQKFTLLAPHGIGVGDQDFSGPGDEYQVLVYNFSEKEAVVKRGERVAQGMFVPVEKVQWEEINLKRKKNRGGFGSTDER